MHRFSIALLTLSLVACNSAPGPGTGSGSSIGSSISSVVATSSVSSVTAALSRSYSDSTFSVNYPAGWSVRQSVPLTTEDYNVVGTAIMLPKPEKSTLDEAQFHVALQESCPAQKDAKSVMINGIAYKQSNWSGVGAGNLYEGKTYTTSHDGKCAVITLYVHSCNLGSDCGEGVTAYDKQELAAMFDSMLSTFAFTK